VVKNGAINAFTRFVIQEHLVGSTRICSFTIMKPVGNGKLSKRDGDKWDFLYFHWIGKLKRRFIRLQRKVFPGSCNQLLALLGWNDGTEKIILTGRISRSF
jgi:hypothetical protein